MNTNSLGKYFSRFRAEVYKNQLKLNDLSSRHPIMLTDAEMLETDEVCPNKFATETLRFWRLKGLLPFFEGGKHARISISQFMWLKYLEELRKVSPSAAILQGAHDYYIKKAYNDRLGYNSLIDLEKQLKAKKFLNTDEQATLSALKGIFDDELLMHSLNRDINYFSLGITEHVIYGTTVQYAYFYERQPQNISKPALENPVFIVIKDGQVESFENGKEPKAGFDYTKTTCVLIPASKLVLETFYDCNISQNAFNIQIMEKSERELFRLIKEKRVQEIILNPLPESGEKSLSFMMLENHDNLSIENIKKVKYKLGTKQYLDGSAIIKGGKYFTFNSDPNTEINSQ
jgi:hypothetical protein